MSLRPKTKRRLLLLMGGGAGLTGLATAGVVVQLHRHEVARQHLRAEGMAAFDRHDYRRTLVELKRYLSGDRVDPDAIYTLAVAQTRVPRPDQGNLTAARQLLIRYLELRPGDRAAQHLLLDVYEKLEFRHEALALADVLLAGDPTDPAALTAEWQELAREGRLDEALAATRRLNDADPTDVVAQEATLELMSRRGQPARALVDRAQRLMDARPGDPRFELVRAIAAHLSGDPGGTGRWLAAAAARPSPDPAFTLTLANAFDRTGRWDDALALLDRAAAAPAAAAAVRLADADRLWYAGRIPDALARLADVSPSDRGADPGLLGLRAMLLDGAAAAPDAVADVDRDEGPPHSVDDLPAVSAIRSNLAARAADPAAAAASALVRATDPAHPVDDRQAVALTAVAARDDANSAAARFFLGRAYARLGEPGLAMEILAQAAALAPAWAAPRLLLASALLDAGQPAAAEAPARAALDRDPASADARAVLALVAYRTLPPQATAAAIRPVLDDVRSAAAADPADPRLPAAAVDLLARSGADPAAVASAVQYLSAPAATPAGVYRVAAVAAVHQVDVSAAVLSRVATLPVDTPDRAYDVAMALATVGQADRGRALLAGHPTADWQLADLRFREATAPLTLPPASLTDAWAALANANPSDLAVQRATLRSPAAARDRPLVDATIKRLHDLTGDDAVEWRLARARFLLEGPTAHAAAAKAADDAVVSSMAEVSRVVPHLAEPLVLWATALEQSDDPAGAAGQLRAAIPLAPDDPTLPVRLAGLLEATGDFTGAVRAVDPLAAEAADLPPAVASDVAEVYRRAGLPERARAVLAANGAAPSAAGEVALAEADAAAGHPAAAAAAFDRVNGSPAATAESVRAAAWYFAAAGDVARGRAALRRLDAVPGTSAVQRAVVGAQFEATFADPATARADLRAAAVAFPDDPRPWAALAGLELRSGDPTAAVSAANRGLARAQADPALSALRDRAQRLASLHLSPAAQPLLDAIAADPTSPAAADTLAALSAGDPAAVAAAVRAVADRDRTFAPAQALAVDQLLAAGEFASAADVATRAADAAPADPAPERLLTAVWTRAGRPDLTLAAARAWRSRSLAAPASADVAIAQAELRLGDPAAAVSQLSPSRTAGTADAAATETYARALSAAGRPADADAVLRPLATKAPRWRQAWLSVIADTAPTAADAARRIGQVLPLLAAGSVTDRIAVASAWATVAARFDDAAAARRGLAELDPLADVSDVPVDASVLAGGPPPAAGRPAGGRGRLPAGVGRRPGPRPARPAHGV